MFDDLFASSFVVRTAHDWFIEVGEWRFGIQEAYVSDGYGKQFPPTTDIYVGPASIETSLSAYAVLAILVIGLLFAVSGLSLVITKFSRQKRDATVNIK